MPQATKTAPKKPSKKEQAERANRVKRGSQAVQDTLKRENLALTVNRIQIFERQADRLIPAGELTPSVMARILGLPEGSVIIPRVELVAAQSPNGAR